MFKNFIKSLGFALDGIEHAVKDNTNIRIHFIIGALVIVASLLLGLTKTEKIIILLTVMFVICVEMINTSIEEMTNLITKEHRAEAKIAKDVGAGMVLVAAFGAIVIGLVIFIPYIQRLI